MATKKTEQKVDERPRFGWTDSLDKEPQVIYEKKARGHKTPVVVIPLPFMSAKLRREIREFAKHRIWPTVVLLILCSIASGCATKGGWPCWKWQSNTDQKNEQWAKDHLNDR